MAEEKLSVVLRGINELSTRLSKQLQASGKNNIISSINIHSILALISQDLWFYNIESFNNLAADLYKDISALLYVGDHVSLANRALLKNGHELQENFRASLINNFVYDITSINFDRSEDFADTINSWISDQTFERIKIDPATLDAESCLTLLNAIHFGSKWTQPFKVEDTVPAPFHVTNNETVEVLMMKTKSEFYFTSLLGVKILELPFVNSDISLVVVLPATDFCFGSQNYYNLLQISKDMVKQEVDVSLPKFTIEENIELKRLSLEMGLAETFNATLFEAVKDKEVNLSNIQQKAFIRVTEEGAETAAGTMSSLNTVIVDENPTKDGIIIYEMNMNTDVTNRYAKTEVVWKLRNVKKEVNKVNFKVILTETAFITGFVMEIEEKKYKSYIKEKEVAQNIYNVAVGQGQSAGLVAATTRDSREFTVSINVEPEIVAKFTLTYEEMLVRVHDQYEIVLTICPGQIVQNLNVEVHINESKPLAFVKTPPLRSGKEITISNESSLDPSSEIKMENSKTAVVKFHPNIRNQKKFACYLREDVLNGLCGQFVVQYDVERNSKDGEVLLQDGYFVHYLAPNDLDPLPKHVVFVLDTSGSMFGRKITQLKDAMISILGEMKREDMITIIEFNTHVIMWDIHSKKYTTLPQTERLSSLEYFSYLNELFLPEPASATEVNISNAKTVVGKMHPDGGTFIIGALQVALYMVTRGQVAKIDLNCQPIVVFLTDGQPNVGLSRPEQIVEVVTLFNKNIKVPIFSLSFGEGADKHFLRKLSLRNHGFSRHIYEASDASLQLQQFYKQISSPALSDVQFKYDSEVEEVTRTCFPIYFMGSELVVCGKYNGLLFPTWVHCCSPVGRTTIKSTMEKSSSSLERLWAYLTVKQLLEERDLMENKVELTKKAVALALKYSFVTDVTSLVVVKPLESNSINTDYGAMPSTEYFFRYGEFGGAMPSTHYSSPGRFGGAVPPTQFVSSGGFGAAMPPTQAFSSGGFGGAIPSTQALPLGGLSGAMPSTQDFSSRGFGGAIPLTLVVPFGGSSGASTNSATFGGFGAPAIGQSSTFGSAAPMASAQGVSFGGFGGATTGQSLGFGHGSLFGQTSVFGSTAPAIGQSSTFGSAASMASAQGVSFGGFGGATTGQSLGFGHGSLFGQTSVFGSTAPAIGQSSTFGSAASMASAQGVSFGGFGGATTGQSLGFGHGSLFGQTSVFGSTGPKTSPLFSGGGTVTSQSGAFGTGDSSGQQGFSFGVPTSQNSATSGGQPSGQSSDESGDPFLGPVVSGTSQENPLDLKKKKTEEFVANRPFHIFLKYKKNNKVIVLFQGRVCKPHC